MAKKIRASRGMGFLSLSVLMISSVAGTAEAANDPKDLPSQNAADSNIVESTGQAHFRIEIPVPKGTAGSEPQLALSYTSNLADGPFGVGWNVALGEIRRTARFGTPSYDSADQFEFDGVLLVEDAANPGEYRTYQESFARITRRGTPNGSDDQWLVEFPDGRKARFGMDQSARIRKGGSLYPDNDWGAVGRWLVSELEDVNGNITRFTYDRTRDIGTAYPRSIEYTFRNGSETPVGGYQNKRWVSFELEPRMDEMGREHVIFGFPLGIETRIAYRVGEIRSYLGSDVYRRLILSYADSAGHDTGRTRLWRAQLFGAHCASHLNPETKCQGFPAREFTYTDSGEIDDGMGQWDPNEVWHGGDSLHFTQGEEAAQGRDRGVRIGDINGDGYPDYVRARRKATSAGSWVPEHEVYLNDGSGWGDFDPDWTARLTDLRVETNVITELRVGANARQTCATENYYSSNPLTYVYFRAENPFNYEQAGYNRWIAAAGEARLIDLNGDGFSDIIVSFKVGAGSSTANSGCGSLASWGAPLTVKHVFINNAIEDPTQGGGWTDLSAEWAGGIPVFYSIYLRTDAGTASQTPGLAWAPGKWRGNPSSPNNPSEGITFAYFFDHGVRMPDLNGDGRPDLVAKREPARFGTGSDVKTFREGAWLSDPDGAGWVRNDDYIPPVSIVAEFNFRAGYPKYVHDADTGVRFADLDGDGLADLVKTSVAPIASHGALSAALEEAGVWLNTGEGWCGESSGNPGCAAAQKYLPPTEFTTISEVYQPPVPTRVTPVGDGGNLALVRSSQLAFVDLNGDDLVDLLKTDSADLTGLNAWIHDPSRPDIWDQDDRYVPDPIMATTGRWLEAGNRYIFDNGVRIYDYNGDATVDFMKDRLQTPSAPRAIHVSRTAHIDLLETFANGQGGIQTLEYTSAIKQRDPTFEALANAHAGPSYADEIGAIGLPRWTARSIVSRITAEDTLDGGTAHSTTLKYAMPRWDPKKRTSLGFRGVWAIHEDGDATPGNEHSKLTYFWQQPGRTGRPNWITTFEGVDAIHQRVTTWEALPGSTPNEGSIAGVQIGRLTRETQQYYYDGEPGSSQETTYEYSDGLSVYGYNFVHKITQNRPTGDLIIQRVPDSSDMGGNWIKGKVATERHEDEYGGLLEQTDYAYDGRGLPSALTRAIKHRYTGQTPTRATTSYLFDSFGNPIEITDPEGRTTYLCWDGDAAFEDGTACRDGMGTGTHTVVVSVKDPLGEETGFSGEPMDLASGKPTRVDRLYSGDSDWVDVDAFDRPTSLWTRPSGHNKPTILATRDYFDDPLAPGNLAGRPYVVDRSYSDASSARADGATVRSASYADGFNRSAISVSPTAPAAAHPYGRAITARDYVGRPTRATLDIACGDDDCHTLAEATGPSVPQIQQAYDAMGRVLSRKTPDGEMLFAYRQADFTPPAGLRAGASVRLDVVLVRDASGVLSEYLLDGDRVVVANECDAVDPSLTDLSGVSCSNADSTFYTYEASGEVDTIYDATADYASPAHRLTYRYDTLGRIYSIVDPDGGETITTYDKVGNVKRTINTSLGPSSEVNYQYDALDRLWIRDTPDQLGDWDLEVTYDPRSRKRWKVTSTVMGQPASYRDVWEYDDYGNLEAHTRSMNQRTLRTDFQFDLLGRLVTIQSPLESVEGISYGYAGAYLTRICSKWDIAECEAKPSLYHVDDVEYDALGRVATLSEAPGDLKFGYYALSDGASGRAVQRVKWAKLGEDGARLNFAYQYNESGQLIHIDDAHTPEDPSAPLDATAAYDYDRRGRLYSWSAAHHGRNPKFYAYDEIGNLRGRNLGSPDEPWNQDYYDGETGNPGAGGPHAIARNHEGKVYAYDAAGNVIQRGMGEFVTYNSLGQIYCVGPSQGSCAGGAFWYDIDGNLLSKTADAGSEIYVASYFRYRKNTSTAWTYTSAFGRRIAMEQRSGASLRAAWAPPAWSRPSDRALPSLLLATAVPIAMLVLLAWLGAHEAVAERPVTACFALALSALIATPPQAGAAGKRGGGGRDKTPWVRYMFHDHLGSEVLATGPEGDVLERRVFDPFGEVVASRTVATASVPRSFTGKPYHAEANSYHFGARWYDAEAGRFVSVDPILQSLADPEAHNPYTYAGNDPVGNIDRDGREFGDVAGGGSTAPFAMAFWAAAFNSFFGGGLEGASPAPIPHGPPASGDVVTAGNSTPHRVGEMPGLAESTAKMYGGKPQGGVLAENGEAAPQRRTAVPRLPDFYNLSVNVALPIPVLPLGLVGWTFSFSVDRELNRYFGIGPNVGKALTGISGNSTGNWLNQRPEPTEQELESFLAGHGFNVGGGWYVGGGVTWSPGNGTATGLGVYSPQIGAGYTYSWQIWRSE